VCGSIFNETDVTIQCMGQGISLKRERKNP
jgi:hypothetical protein